MANSNSDKLTKGDIISFIALLLLGVCVFFGMNFQTLGNKILSIIVAIVLVVVMTVFVFLAAFAKAQNRNQSKWRAVEYTMLVLYLLALIPCYIYSSKFLDVQLGKGEIINQAQADVDNLEKMFKDYNRKCEARCNSYQTYLEAMSKNPSQRQLVADSLGISVSNLTMETISQASTSFLNKFKGTDYKLLEESRKNLKANILGNFKNWNILLVPQYASDLDAQKKKFGTELQAIYDRTKSGFEKDIPQFNANSFVNSDGIAEAFSRSGNFSFMGLLAVLVLGGLGLVKYLLGEKRTVIELKKGSASAIGEDGGFTF